MRPLCRACNRGRRSMIDPSLRRKSPLRRRKKAERRVGKVSGTVRLSGAAMEHLREQRYRMDGERCTWKGCGVWLPLYGSVFNRAHLAHIKSHGAGGGDTIENTHIRCFLHHIEFEHTKGTKDGAD